MRLKFCTFYYGQISKLWPNYIFHFCYIIWITIQFSLKSKNLGMFKKQGTPLLLSSSDRPSWLSYQLSFKQVVKRDGKFKLPKWPNLHIWSTKREPIPQWPPTASYSYNFWSWVGSPIPMTSQWPQTASFLAVSNMIPSYWSE